jgi:hypothetical protein
MRVTCSCVVMMLEVKRPRASAFMLGRLADLPRKNCWRIAEQDLRVESGVIRLDVRDRSNTWP